MTLKFLKFAYDYAQNNQDRLDRCNPAKAGWKHRLVSRQWKDTKEADACLIWAFRFHGRAAGGEGPSSNRVWDGQFLPMENETCSRVVFYTNDDNVAKEFSEKWT